MRRVYDKSVKGYVYHLSGGPGHKLALPKDAAKSPGLGLTQPFVVFQVFVPEGHHASFEIQFSDERGTRRRLLMSTSFVETKPSPLHCQVPLPPSALPPERWTQLAVHVPSMARALFSDNAASQGAAGFRAVEHVGVGAHCRLRRVFTLRDAPEGDEAFFDASIASSAAREREESPIVAKPTPRAVDFPKDTPHKVSVVTPSRLSRFGQQSSRERGLSSRGEAGRSRGASREGSKIFEPPGSPHARGGGPRGVSRDGGSRRGSVDADGLYTKPTERWGFAALATSSGDGDVDAAHLLQTKEGWQIAFGSRVSTPARGSRPSSRAKESASREQHSRGDRRANARPAGDGDGAFERDSPNRLSASLARGLSFEKEKTKTVPADAASRSLSKSQNFSTGEALGGALSDARGPRACSAAPSTRTKTATAPAAPDFGGWDFMRDGVSTRGGGLFASPEKRESRKNETGEPVREPEPGTTHEASADARPRAYDARRYFPDDEAGDGVAFVDGDGTRSGDADSGGWGALRPKPMAGYGRGETPIPGRVDPGGDPSSLLERDYRMYTPELVVVSDRREGGGRSAGEKANREEVDADAPSAGVGSGSAPRVSVSASSDSSTAEKENELTEELARVSPGLDPEKTKLAADRVADLDLVYDPILNFYYDPKNGKYYELA